MPSCPVEVLFDADHYPEGPNRNFKEASEQELLDEFLPKFEGNRQLKNHLDSLINVSLLPLFEGTVNGAFHPSDTRPQG